MSRASSVLAYDLADGRPVATTEVSDLVVGLVSTERGVVTRTAGGTLVIVPQVGREPRWSVALDASVSTDPAVSAATAYVATDAGEIVAVGLEDGRVGWRRDLGGSPGEAPVLVGDLVLAVVGQTLVALDAGSGEPRWDVEFPAPLAGPPAAAGDQVRLALTDGTVLALEAATGATREQFDIGSPLLAGPWVVRDSTYVLTATSLVAIAP